MTQFYQQLATLLLTISAAHAVEWPILSIKVEGLKNYSTPQVLAVAGIKTGEMANRERFEAARDRLVATGAFDEVSYKYAPTADGKGYAAIFQVRESAPLYPVRFEDLKTKPEILMDVLKKADPMFGPKIPGTVQVVKRYVDILKAYLKEDIVGRVATEESGELAVVFRPAQGQPSIAEVYFQGNKAIDEKTLQNAVAGSAVGLVFQERRFRLQLDLAIRPLYEALGYVRVQFPKVELEQAKDVNGLVARVTVQEGEVYKLAKVDLAGAPPAAERAADFKTDEVFNINAIEAGRQKVDKAMRKTGYLRVKSSFERSYDDSKKTVSLVLKVDPGPQFLMGKLDIVGLDIQTEPAVRKMWTLQPGKPFNGDYPDYFLQRLREDGVFDNLGDTKSAVKINDTSKTVDVSLLFRGAPPRDERHRRKQSF